jgi:hypothetical protein
MLPTDWLAGGSVTICDPGASGSLLAAIFPGTVDVVSA